MGFKIGPLNAASNEFSLALFNPLTGLIPEGSDVLLDIPEPNHQALEIAENSGMLPVFETARMYMEKSPKMSLDKIFGITSFAFG
jgi:hypothetical protein